MATTDLAKTPNPAKQQDTNKARHSVTINHTTPAQVYAFWRDFRNLPLFMKDLSSVEMKSDKVSHWTVQLKNGLKAEWDAQVTMEREGELISWESLPGSEVTTAGTVWFMEAPANRGTIVRLTMGYQVPGGKLTELATKLTLEDPDTLILVNLRRLKAYLETGEIPTTEGQPSGREEHARPVVTH